MITQKRNFTIVACKYSNIPQHLCVHVQIEGLRENGLSSLGNHPCPNQNLPAAWDS